MGVYLSETDTQASANLWCDHNVNLATRKLHNPDVIDLTHKSLIQASGKTLPAGSCRHKSFG